MKVIGLGAPETVRIRFAACELDVLVDELRNQRAGATERAAETYDRLRGRQTDERMIDDHHDELREIEALLISLDEVTRAENGSVQLVGRRS